MSDMDFSINFDVKFICKDGKVLWFPKSIIDKYPQSTLYAALNGKFIEGQTLEIHIHENSKHVNALLNDLYIGNIDVYLRSYTPKFTYKYIMLLNYVNCFEMTSREVKKLIKDLVVDTSNFDGDCMTDSKSAKYIVKLYTYIPDLIPDRFLLSVLIAYTCVDVVPISIFKDLNRCRVNTGPYKYANIIGIATALLRRINESGKVNDNIYYVYCTFLLEKTTLLALISNDAVVSVHRAIEYIKKVYGNKIVMFKGVLLDLVKRYSNSEYLKYHYGGDNFYKIKNIAMNLDSSSVS